MTETNQHLADRGAVVFHCVKCGIAVTSPMFPLPATRALHMQDQQPAIDSGFFTEPAKACPGENLFGTAADDYVVNLTDLRNIAFGGYRGGCCGTSAEGPHIFCANGHGVGTERTDCWMPHFGFLHHADVIAEPSAGTAFPMEAT